MKWKSPVVFFSIITFLAGAYGLDLYSTESYPFCAPPIEPSSSEDILAAVDPTQEIVGSAYTNLYDCRYLKPPKSLTVSSLPFDCDKASHNLEVYKKGCPFYISQSTAKDGPVWCLYEEDINSAMIKMTSQRKRAYCK